MSPSKARIPSVKRVPDGRATAGPAWSPAARGRASPGSATTAADSATKADTRTCATSPMPTAIAPPASSAPATPPRLNSAWNDDMIGRPTRCSTSAAWAFIDTSRRPLQAPRRARESESRATLGLATGRGEREAERDTGGRRHHATTEPADEPARHRERDHRARRHGQEDEPELTVAHHVTALDCWDVRDPTGEHGAVDEEEDGNRRARPARCHRAVGTVSHVHRFVPIA